jgi:hypothetical protein
MSNSNISSTSQTVASLLLTSAGQDYIVISTNLNCFVTLRLQLDLNMPALVRKLLIFAAVDGLILQPALHKSTRGSAEPAIKISYKGAAISPVLQDKKNGGSSILEVHGIIGRAFQCKIKKMTNNIQGLLKVASSSFLISISRREQVATMYGKPIYSITEVALIPLSSQDDAEKAIVRAKDSQQRHEKPEENVVSQYYDDDEQTVSLADDASISHADPDSPIEASAEESQAKVSGIAEDIFQKKGIYGRFTDKWFSQKGWNSSSRRSQGLSSDVDLSRVKSASADVAASEVSLEQAADSKEKNLEAPQDDVVPAEVVHVVEPPSNTSQLPLLSKLLTTTKIFFGSRNFYFSYDYDISRSVSRQVLDTSSVSLHKTFDPIVSDI